MCKSVTSTSDCMADLSLHFSLSFKREKPQEGGWRTTTVEPKFISTTSRHIMGNQTRWDVIAVKSLYTTHFVPMHSRRKVRQRREQREERLSDGLFGRQGCLAHRRALSSAGRWTGTCHLECEAAGVILRDTVRWSGWPCLRSAQLLLPLIFNRCLGARPAKSSHMPEQGNQSKDPAAGWATRLRHTHSC